MMRASGGGSSPSSTVARAGTVWRGSASLGSAANCASDTARDRKINSAPSGLIVNALILWNTRYLDAALDHPQRHGFEPKPEDLARLSPLRSRHFNVLGR